MRWICRCVRPPLEPVTSKAEHLPSSSSNSGADARKPDERAIGTCVGDAVRAAREAGDSWTIIGTALDTTRQAAQQAE
jgi:hypothetical protein